MSNNLPIPPGRTTKMVMDEHKGWFDYASCCLGVAAWDVALFGVSYNTWVTRADIDWFSMFLSIITIAVGTLFAFFLHSRLWIMSRAMIPVVRDMLGRDSWKLRVFGIAWMCWADFGHQIFVVTFALHLITLLTGLYSKY